MRNMANMKKKKIYLRQFETMDETYLSVFHSVSNRVRGKRSRNISSSVHTFFFLSHARDYDVHVT